MTLKFFDGLDTYRDSADLTASSSVLKLPASLGRLELTSGRFGGGALVTSYSMNSSITAYPMIIGYPMAVDTKNYIGLSCFFGGVVTGLRPYIMAFYDANNVRLGGICVDTSNAVVEIRDQPDSVRARSIRGIIKPNVWQRIEVMFVPGSTNSNGSIAVQVDGQTVASVTNIDTFNSASYPPTYIRVNGLNDGSQYSSRFDDLTICDDQGSTNNSWMGDVRIDNLLPDGNGTDQDWIANTGNAWQAVDENPNVDDGDTTYVYATTVGNKSSFTVGDLASASTKIAGVQVRSKIKKTDAGAKTLKSYIISGSTPKVDAVGISPSSSAYVCAFSDIAEVDPDTGSDWTNTTINAIEVGMAVAS